MRLEVGDIDHREERVAVGQRNRRELEMPAVGHRNPPARRLSLIGRLPNHLADLCGGGRVDELARHRRDQLVDARMGGEPLLVQFPVLEEAAFQVYSRPSLANTLIASNRLSNVAARTRSKRVARRSQPKLLRAILEEQPEAAVGQRLRDHSDVVAAGEHPLFLDHLVGAGEPVAPLLLPGRKIARFRQSADCPASCR